MEEIEKLKQLIYVTEILLTGTNEQLNIVNHTFLDLKEKALADEFVNAICVNEEGYLQMQECYKGFFVGAIKMLDERRQFLQMQKEQCITKIKEYQNRLNQLMATNDHVSAMQQTRNTFQVRPGGISPVVTKRYNENVPIFEENPKRIR